MPKLRWAASCFGRQSNASRKYGKIISIYPHVPSEICLHEDITSRAQPDLSGTPFSLTQPNWASQWSCHSCLQLSSGKVSREDYGEPQRCETPLLVAVLDVFGRSSVNTREQHLVFTGFTVIRKFPWKSWNSHFFIFLFFVYSFRCFGVQESKAHHLRPDTDTGRAARGLHGPHRGAVCRVSQRAVLRAPSVST
jgi:hypothetical protein